MSVEAFERLITPKPGRTLIVGSRVYGAKEDRRKRYAHVLGVDMQAGVGVDVVADLEIAALDGAWHHIECMSVLEHCKRPWLMAANLEKMLEAAGTIFIAAPFVWKVHGYPDDYWRFTISGVKSLFTAIEWTQEAYSHRHLCRGEDIPAARAGEDWPHMAVTEVCLFGHRL
jgi:hypothetical protein